MEGSGHSHHHHGHRPSHRSAKRKARVGPERWTHHSTAGTSHRPAHAPAKDDISYIESWLEGMRSSGAARPAQPLEIQDRSKVRAPARRHGRQRSEDSSIIAPASHRHQHVTNRQAAHKLSDIPVKPHKAPNNAHGKRARPSPSVHSDDDAPLAEEGRRYEKRARHKTRQDKYKPNHGGPARRKSAASDEPKRKERSNDKRKRKRSALATAGDLMDKFSSDAIHNDRLTIKPSAQAGIFRNSKTDKAPGDLTFGEMSFLKEARPQEVPKMAPKSRSRDQKRNQKELEDIEVFFSHTKPSTRDAERGRREKREQHVSRASGAGDGSLRAQRRRSGASGASRATTYFSWSNSSPPPPQPEQDPEGTNPSPVRKNSPTPESVRQELVETGIYRTLSEPDRRLYGRDQEGHEESLGYPPEAPESRAHLARQAYVGRRGALLQSPGPSSQPMEGPKSRGSRPGEPPALPISPVHLVNSRSMQSDTGHIQQSVPPVMSPINGSVSSQNRSTTALISKDRPLSRLRYAMPAFRPQSSLPWGRPPTVVNTGRWLLATSPHFRDVRATRPDPRAPSRLGHLGAGEQEPFAKDGAGVALGEARPESMREYIASLEQEVLGANDENHPPTGAGVGRDLYGAEAYLAPFFRRGTAAGFVPVRQVDARECGSWQWQSQSGRRSAHLENSPSGTSPQHAPLEQGVHLDGQDLPLGHTQSQRAWPAGTSYAVQDGSASRYWKPNTYGL